MTTQQPDQSPVRRLSLVRATDPAPVITQIADMPDSYRVRRGGPAAALMARSRGNWLILFGHDPKAAHAASGEWSRQAAVAGSYSDREAAEVALLLADAHASNVPAYLECVFEALSVPVLLDLLRLHRPDYTNACEPEGGAEPWRRCPTVRIIAASLGVKLAD